MKYPLYQLFRRNLSLDRIVELSGKSMDQIKDYINRNHLRYPSRQISKYFVDDEFFDVIDTERKAYWLGFLYADGCIKEDLCISVGLGELDKDHVYMFRQHIRSEHPIVVESKSFGDGPKSNTHYLRMHCRYMAQQLIDKGCSKRKSFTLQFSTENQVPRLLMPHFIRGFFDGDGSIWGKKSKYRGLDFVSNKTFIESLGQYLDKMLDMRSAIKDHPTAGIVYLRYFTYDDINKIYHFLYDDANVYLSRKKEKMIEVLRHENAQGKTAVRRFLRANPETIFTTIDIRKQFGITSNQSCRVLRDMLARKEVILVGDDPLRYKIAI